MIKKILSITVSDTFIYGFMWVTIILGAAEAVIAQRWSLLFVILITALLIATPTVLRRRYAIDLPRGIVLMAIFFAYTSLFLGEAYDFYERFWWWDLFLHGASAFGFALISLGVVRMMVSAHVVEASHGLLMSIVFGFTLAMGALWEIFEFSMDALFGWTMQNGSLPDTMGDLIVDSLSALAVCIGGYVHWKYGKKNFIGKAVEKMFHKYLQ